MQHGAKFEERTREILRGQVFEPEHIPEMICGDCHRPVLMGKQEEKK
jgi:hypothetical protein